MVGSRPFGTSTLLDTSGTAAVTVAASPAPIDTPTLLPTAEPDPSPSQIPYETPDWFKDAILYEIFVRSFYDSDGDGVGDLDGVTARLDYLESLGVTALWLMPIHPSPSVHGYDVTDYAAVNPAYGSLEDLQNLVREAHARDLRVLLDFVPSHLSVRHPFFQDAYGKPSSPYSDWFVWTNEAHTQYAGFAGNREMPRFNHFKPETVDFLVEQALYWLDLDGDGDYSDGVDGFRVDNATFPPQEFFITLRQQVKAVDPDAVLLGEIWVDNSSDLNRFYTDQFDGLFDFPLYGILQGNHDFNADGLLAGQGFPTLLSVLFREQAERYPAEAVEVRFFNNHDTNRIATELDRDESRLRLVPALIASLPGAVKLYYGEEIGMPGQKGGPPYWDNYRREPMDWYAEETGEGMTAWFRPEDRWNEPLDGVSVAEQTDDPDSLLNLYRKAIRLRREHPGLRDGSFEILPLESSGASVWAFSRGEGSEAVVAIFNFSDQTLRVTFERLPIEGSGIVDLLTGAPFPEPLDGEPYTLDVLAASAILLAAP